MRRSWQNERGETAWRAGGATVVAGRSDELQDELQDEDDVADERGRVLPGGEEPRMPLNSRPNFLTPSVSIPICRRGPRLS